MAWPEIVGYGSAVALVGALFRFQNGRINSKVSRTEYDATNTAVVKKVDEVKTLLLAMDTKREKAKDEWHEAQREMGGRLSRIEGALNGNPKG